MHGEMEHLILHGEWLVSKKRFRFSYSKGCEWWLEEQIIPPPLSLSNSLEFLLLSSVDSGLVFPDQRGKKNCPSHKSIPFLINFYYHFEDQVGFDNVALSSVSIEIFRFFSIAR